MNKPAFPVHPIVSGGWTGTPPADYIGLTKREYAAIEVAKAMISTAAAPCFGGLEGGETRLARAAYVIADAILAEGCSSEKKGATHE